MSQAPTDPPPLRPPWRQRLHVIIFGADTPAGKAFDVVLLVLIVLSIMIVLMESVASVAARYGTILRTAEWIVTGLFTVEYALRLLSAGRPLRYARSFFGIIDLLSIVPTYLSVLIAGSQYLLVIRGLRLLRVFRVMKLSRYLGEAEVLQTALRQSLAKITVFIGTVVTVVLIIGAAMYLIEGPENGFGSIPISIYWAVVTLTTVGYGDIAPQTTLGQAVATLVMILGYGIIAVPTGIVSVELSKAERRPDPPADGPTRPAGGSPHPQARPAAATRVWFDEERVCFGLIDGRQVAVPLAWYPALRDANADARAVHLFMAENRVVHWPELKVDIMVEDLLA